MAKFTRLELEDRDPGPPGITNPHALTCKNVVALEGVANRDTPSDQDERNLSQIEG